MYIVELFVVDSLIQVHGRVPFQNLNFYSFQRKSETRFLAVPLRKMIPDGSFIFTRKTHHYYGYMQDKNVFVAYSEVC